MGSSDKYHQILECHEFLMERASSCDVVANMLDYDFIHFQTYILGKVSIYKKRVSPRSFYCFLVVLL